jgi:hypothetical protein
VSNQQIADGFALVGLTSASLAALIFWIFLCDFIRYYAGNKVSVVIFALPFAVGIFLVGAFSK